MKTTTRFLVAVCGLAGAAGLLGLSGCGGGGGDDTGGTGSEEAREDVVLAVGSQTSTSSQGTSSSAGDVGEDMGNVGGLALLAGPKAQAITCTDNGDGTSTCTCPGGGTATIASMSTIGDDFSGTTFTFTLDIDITYDDCGSASLNGSVSLAGPMEINLNTQAYDLELTGTLTNGSTENCTSLESSATVSLSGSGEDYSGEVNGTTSGTCLGESASCTYSVDYNEDTTAEQMFLDACGDCGLSSTTCAALFAGGG